MDHHDTGEVVRVELLPLDPPGDTCTANLVRLSADSILLDATDRITAGDLVQFRALDSRGKTVFEGRGRCAWSGFEGPPFDCALRFTYVGQDSAWFIEQWILDDRQDRLARSRRAPVPEPRVVEPAAATPAPQLSAEPAPEELPEVEISMEDAVGKSPLPSLEDALPLAPADPAVQSGPDPLDMTASLVKRARDHFSNSQSFPGLPADETTTQPRASVPTAEAAPVPTETSPADPPASAPTQPADPPPPVLAGPPSVAPTQPRLANPAVAEPPDAAATEPRAPVPGPPAADPTQPRAVDPADPPDASATQPAYGNPVVAEAPPARGSGS